MTQAALTQYCSPFQGVVETLTGEIPLRDDASPDDKFLWRAAQQADLGQGRCSPNPPVGAVVVRDGQVVGEGFHARAGEAHGEIAALDRAGSQARDATLYVTLEPCNHHGRTGPCTERILREGIRRVVVGVRDPNPRVVGNGITRLSEAGLEVSLAAGDVAARCGALIAPFAKSSVQRAPWIVAKVAVTRDGCVGKNGVARYPITGPLAQRWVHTLRDRVDAILVGAGTALGDDPALTVRHEQPLRSDAKNPLRVVVDGALRTTPDLRIYQRDHRDPAPGVHACVVHRPGLSAEKTKRFDDAGIRRLEVPTIAERLSLPALWASLLALDVVTLLVEPGPRLFRALLAQRAIDELWWLQAPMHLGQEGLRLFEDSTLPPPTSHLFAAGAQRHNLGEDSLRLGTLQSDSESSLM